MRWSICLIPLFLISLACEDPLGTSSVPVGGSFEGKNDAVIQTPSIGNNIRVWDASAEFALGGSKLFSAVKVLNQSNTITANIQVDITIYTDSLRTPESIVYNKCCKVVVVPPLVQQNLAYQEETSLSPSPSTYYWTIAWRQQ